MKPASVILLLAFSAVSARMREGASPVNLPRPGAAEIQSIPNYQQCTHKAGRLWLTVTNYGILGNRNDYLLKDCLTGRATSSAEFPGGSKIEHLFQAALWIGAVAGSDTLTAVGSDGWLIRAGNLNPLPGPKGEIIKRSLDPSSPFYNPKAVSDQDLIATMYDTLSDCQFTNCYDPADGTPYRPLGLKVVLNSYSWATAWGQDWVLLDYRIFNIGKKDLNKVYLGMFVDADVGYLGRKGSSFNDDLSGLKVSEPNGYRVTAYRVEPPIICEDTIDLAYSYDNDGDPYNGLFVPGSPTAATGIEIMRPPPRQLGQLKTSFNWWMVDSGGAFDWGPQKFPGIKNFAGRLGQPEGHKMRYSYLSNREKDYDQVFAAINQQFNDIGFGRDWLSPLDPQSAAIDLANGFDTRYLLSFGPFDLLAGDSLPFTLAYVAGDGFHTDPNNFAENLGSDFDYLNEARVRAYLEGLDPTALLDNARLARQVFDNWTDSTRYVCGRVQNPNDLGFYAPVSGFRRHGDGIPDLKGPQPPPLPPLEFTTAPGEVTVRWFGRETEEAIDRFTGLKDFEGYRVQMSTDGGYYTVIGTYDKVDWKPFFFNTALRRWRPAPVRPLSYDEIQEIYAVQWDTCRNKPGHITRPINPEKYNVPIPNINLLPSRDLTSCNPDTTKTVIKIHFCNACSPQKTSVDTSFYFAPQDYNLGLKQARLYPEVTDPNNDSAYWYQYKISGLFPYQPVYIAVTPFDFGKLGPNVSIDPVEVTPFSAGRLVYPLAGDSARRADSLKISVYPNPYRTDRDYSYFEKPQQNSGITLSTQRINFINLPPSCIIRIYTLDGDLVQELKHSKDPAAGDAGLEQWDLLSRNTQEVVAGLYIFTVQANGAYKSEGTYIGKIVIIK